MPEHRERIVRLEVNGAPVTRRTAELIRGQAILAGGLPGLTSWRIQLVDPDLALGLRDTVAIRVDSGSGWEAGAALVDGLWTGSGMLRLDGTGDLLPG